MTILLSLRAAPNPGERVTRNTVRLSFACYIIALISMVRLAKSDRPAHTPPGRIARWCWTFANLYFLTHVAAAFNFYHHWSHRNAFERTRAISGSGYGLYVSYVFTILWTADVAWWWLQPKRYASRAIWIGRALHIFMLFIIFNGTVIFASGPIRVAGIISFALVAGFLGEDGA